MTVDALLKENIENRQKDFRKLMIMDGLETAVKDGYAEDCKCLLPEGKTISGHSELLKYLEEDESENEFTFKFEDVEGNEEWAFIRGVYAAQLDGKLVDAGKFITIWHNENGKFVIYQDMWNSSMKV